MKTPIASIACFLLASLLGAAGQFLYKTGADAASGSAASFLSNWRILAGVGCYAAVMILFVAAFRQGGEMSVLYPLYASTFIWGALIARIAFGTPIAAANVAGMALLVAGMCLMGLK